MSTQKRSSRSQSKKTQAKVSQTKEVQDDLPKKRQRTPVKDDIVESKPIKKAKKEKVVESSPDTKQNDNKKEPAKKQLAKMPTQVDDSQKQIKKITMTGSVPVDSNYPTSKSGQVRVLEKDGQVYASTLNQSNVAHNNNKFYIIQAIVDQGNGDFALFCRWGRVGVVGQMSSMRTNDVNHLIRQYHKKLREKTNGGYTVVEMNYDDGSDQKKAQENAKKQQKNQPEVESSLPKQVQDLIRLIFDMKMMNNQMKQIGYDAKKMPLGKLSKSSIEKGYEALKKAMDEVKGKRTLQKLQQYSNEFYSNIPHDFGFIKMQNFILDTEQKIKQKLEMLQSLQDIQIYTKLLNQGKICSDMNEIDSNYLKLRTDIKPLDKKSQLFQKLVKYVKNTHASTHNNFRLEVQQIYRLDKQQQNLRYTKDIPNKQLLWHGSRLTNFVGILSQGLRIAPPEAPVTGYMFGKGVYFADMVSKSANYCCTSKTNNTGLMLLCEVALGNCWQKFQSDYYASNLPHTMNSTKGVGRTAPKRGQMIEDAWAPNQVGEPTGVAYTQLLYNQYIVYSVNQIKSKFLFRLKFHYN